MFDAFTYIVIGMAIDRFVLRKSVLKRLKIILAAGLKSLMDELEEARKKDELEEARKEEEKNKEKESA